MSMGVNVSVSTNLNLSQRAPSLTPQQFVAKWAETALTERASAQAHFVDLCHLIGLPTPAEADPSGAWYAFEQGVTTTRGRRGFADVWLRGHFAWEYKGKGKHVSLNDAYQQLLLYHEDLENPPLLVVCDIERYEIHTKFSGTVTEVHRFTNDDILARPEPLRLLRDLFTNPEALRPSDTPDRITQEAARKFAGIADGLRARGVEAERAAHFLTRLLFCLFAEDIGLLPKDIFRRTVEFALRRPDSFVRQTEALFVAMRDGGDFALEEIARFNGNLFAESDVLELTPAELALLAEASTLDWSSIEPAIFGTLFERGLDPAKRAQLGAHYTSREDILLIVEPVLLEPLRRAWADIRAQADELVRAWWAAGDQRTRTRRRQELERLLFGFQERLARVTVLDPACGSGNFLYVSLTLLKDLEKEVITYAARAGLPFMMPRVSVKQLKGIEINPFAHDLAQVAVWIGFLQWMSQNGMPIPRDPVLDPLDTILQMDAILDRSDPAHPREPEWPAADVIVGNPPFLGGKRLRTELGDDYVDAMFAVWDKRVPREADLCCYWHETARAQIDSGRAKRAGLLATSAIRRGANRAVLTRIKTSGDLFMAWSDRPWILEGASVRISMVGFDNGTETHKSLDGVVVSSLNPDLTASTDYTVSQRLDENSGISFMGDTKGGPFDISADLARQMLVTPQNPNGRPNSDVVIPWLNGSDITGRPRDNWIIDFGTSMSLEEAALYEVPFEYARTHVWPTRTESKTTRPEWWLHERPRVEMRRAIAGLSRVIATPRVSKHRVFVWIRAGMLPDSRTFVFARDDDYFFGVLHSNPHELWSLQLGSRHGGERPTYNATTCFETFPFPWPPGQEPADDARVAAIGEAARVLNELRERWLNPEGAGEAELKKRTLTNLYNQRPTWLDNAHRALDRAVCAAYGWPDDLTDDEILSRLLALNLERAADTGSHAPT